MIKTPSGHIIVEFSGLVETSWSTKLNNPFEAKGNRHIVEGEISGIEHKAIVDNGFGPFMWAGKEYRFLVFMGGGSGAGGSLSIRSVDVVHWANEPYHELKYHRLYVEQIKNGTAILLPKKLDEPFFDPIMSLEI